MIISHHKRCNPEKADSRTSPSFLDGHAERDAEGNHVSGSQVVATGLGILEPDSNGELILTALYPDKSVEKICENTSRDIKISPALQTTQLPNEEELRFLREEFYQNRIYHR